MPTSYFRVSVATVELAVLLTHHKELEILTTACEFFLKIYRSLNCKMIRSSLENFKITSKSKLKVRIPLKMVVNPKKLSSECKRYLKLYLESNWGVHHLYIVTTIGV